MKKFISLMVFPVLFLAGCNQEDKSPERDSRPSLDDNVNYKQNIIDNNSASQDINEKADIIDADQAENNKDTLDEESINDSDGIPSGTGENINNDSSSANDTGNAEVQGQAPQSTPPSSSNDQGNLNQKTTEEIDQEVEQITDQDKGASDNKNFNYND